MPSTGPVLPVLVLVACLLVASVGPVVAASDHAPADADSIASADSDALTATETTACLSGPGGTTASAAESETLSIETFVAPGTDYDRLTNASALAAANESGRLTPASAGVDRTWEDEVVAYRDGIVHRIALNGSATGLLDRLAAQNRGSPTANFRAFLAGDGVEFDYHGSTACPPQLAVNASIDRGAIRVVPDQTNETLSLVLDTDRLLFHPLGGGEPTTDTFVRGHNGFSFTLSESTGLVAENTTVETSYDVTDATVAFGDRYDGLLELDSAPNQSVRGRTTLAPGSEVTVILHPDTANGSALETTATVNRTRGFAGQFDLSEAASGATYAVEVPELTESPVVGGGAPLVAVGNATTALLTVENHTSIGTVLYGTTLTTTDGGFVTVRNSSGDFVGVSDYFEPGTVVAQPDLSPALAENGTVTVTAYRDANGNQEFDDADVPYRANGTAVSDTAEIQIEQDQGAASIGTTTSTALDTTSTTTTTTAESATASAATDDRLAPETQSSASTPGISGFGLSVTLVVTVLVLIRVLSR